MGSRSKVSIAIFIAASLCFLLPFITVSCGGQRIVTVSGVQLATGTNLDQPQMLGPAQKKSVDPEPLVSLAALCAIIGLVLSFGGSAKAALGPAISGGLGFLLLLLLRAKMDDQIARQSRDMLQVSYEAGYTLTLLLLIAGAALNGYIFFSQRAPSAMRGAASPASEPASAQVSVPATTRPATACPHCGAPIEEGSKFCSGCGNPLSASAAAGQSQP